MVKIKLFLILICFCAPCLVCAKSYLAYSLSYSTYDLSVKHTNRQQAKSQVNSHKGKALKGRFNYRRTRKMSFDFGVDLIEASLIAPSDFNIKEDEVVMYNYRFGLSRYSKYLKWSLGVLSDEILTIDTDKAIISLESSRSLFGGGELSLLAKMNRSYGLLLGIGYYLYVSGSELTGNKVVGGDFYKVSSAFRYSSKDFRIDLFLSGGIRTIKSEFDKVHNSHFELGIKLNF